LYCYCVYVQGDRKIMSASSCFYAGRPVHRRASLELASDTRETARSPCSPVVRHAVCAAAGLTYVPFILRGWEGFICRRLNSALCVWQLACKYRAAVSIIASYIARYRTRGVHNHLFISLFKQPAVCDVLPGRRQNAQ
jgi:hypothetical protein